MKYRYTIECCHKTYRMELTIMHVDEDEPDDLTDKFIEHCIERDKVKDGLEGLPHSITKVELSLDDEVWFEINK